MKIVLVNNSFSPAGGAEIMTYWQYLLLKEKGHDVLIFSTDKEPYFENNNLQTEYFPQNSNYSKMQGFEKIKSIPNLYYNKEAEKKLDEFLKKNKPDLVHLNNIRAGLTPSILRACYKNNIPVIQTLHDASLFCPNAVLRINSKTYCKKELCVSGNYLHCIINKCRGDNYLKSLNAALELSLNKFHKFYDGISAFITPSKVLRKLAIKSGIFEDKVIAIPNFIDESYYKVNENYEKGQYFLYVGRISQEKGLDYVIEAFSKLPKEIKFRIVGTGPDKDKLENKVKELNINNVEFAGYKSGENLIKEYQNCIATILPCDWFESFGLTIVESFACSKPVIGSNLGGIPETVIPHETGILIEPGNIDDILNAVKKLYYEDEYRKKLSVNCKNKSQVYSREAYYEAVMKIYEKVSKTRSNLK